MKAILVIDVEENGEYYADIYRRDADDRFEGRHYLKPIPNKRVPDGSETDQIYGCYVGWNACIDEILGETE